jgi:uncharacterized membrane protein
MIGAVVTFLLGVVAASSGHVLIKKGAVQGRDRSIFVSLLNPLVLAGYALMLGSTVTSTIALKVLPLHLIVSLLPLGHVVLVFLSVAVLGEKMRRHHIWGMLIVFAGIVIFNLGPR